MSTEWSWAEKVRRVADVLEEHGETLEEHAVRGDPENRAAVERVAEHVLNAIGDANV